MSKIMQQYHKPTLELCKTKKSRKHFFSFVLLLCVYFAFFQQLWFESIFMYIFFYEIHRIITDTKTTSRKLRYFLASPVYLIPYLTGRSKGSGSIGSGLTLSKLIRSDYTDLIKKAATPTVVFTFWHTALVIYPIIFPDGLSILVYKFNIVKNHQFLFREAINLLASRETYKTRLIKTFTKFEKLAVVFSVLRLRNINKCNKLINTISFFINTRGPGSCSLGVKDFQASMALNRLILSCLKTTEQHWSFLSIQTYFKE